MARPNFTAACSATTTTTERFVMFKRDQSNTPAPSCVRADSRVCAGVPTSPAHALQRSIGNLAVQRLADDGDSFEALMAQRRGAGAPLDAAARAFLEPRLGADLGDVRVHTDSQAQQMAGAVQATAFASGSDLYFQQGAYDPGSPAGLHLLAHEVTHVLQQSRGPVAVTAVADGVSVSDPSDAFEREADEVADAVMAAPQQAVAKLAPVSEADSGDGVAVQREKDEDDGLFGTLGSLVSGAGSAISDVVDGASDAVSSVASGAAGLAREGWQDVSGFAGETYSQMKKDAAMVKEGEGWVDQGIDWAEGKAKSGAHWAASEAKGIPVLDRLASDMETSVDNSVDVGGGLLKGATGMVGGLVGMAADPVDAVAGLETMAEHVPGVGSALKLGHGAYDLAFSDKSAGQIAQETFDPLADGRYWGNVGSALWTPYAQAIKDGKPGEALGRGAFDIGSLFLGAGEAGAAAKVGEVSKVAEMADVGKAAETARAAETLNLTTTDARLQQLADIADSGTVRGVATDPELFEAYEGAQQTRRAPVDSFDNLRGRMDTQLAPQGGLSGPVHHWRYQNAFPGEALDPENLFVADREAGANSAIGNNINPRTGQPYAPHVQMHQVADVPGLPRYRQMADWAMPTQVRDMFNFWNAETPLSDVDGLLEEWQRTHP
jgi:hypothetical protein